MVSMTRGKSFSGEILSGSTSTFLAISAWAKRRISSFTVRVKVLEARGIHFAVPMRPSTPCSGDPVFRRKMLARRYAPGPRPSSYLILLTSVGKNEKKPGPSRLDHRPEGESFGGILFPYPSGRISRPRWLGWLSPLKPGVHALAHPRRICPHRCPRPMGSPSHHTRRC